MTAPDKIFVSTDPFGSMHAYYIENHPPIGEEYIRKDLADEMVKSAEDHAYFAGQEKLREKLMEWAKEQLAYYQKLEDDEVGPVRWGQRNAFKQIIDKINSL